MIYVFGWFYSWQLLLLYFPSNHFQLLCRAKALANRDPHGFFAMTTSVGMDWVDHFVFFLPAQRLPSWSRDTAYVSNLEDNLRVVS